MSSVDTPPHRSRDWILKVWPPTSPSPGVRVRVAVPSPLSTRPAKAGREAPERETGPPSGSDELTVRTRVSRARISCEFPAHFQFIGSANPCPCGWRGSGKRDCRCDDGAIARYAARISGPLLDRIDLCVSVQPLAWRELDTPGRGERSAAVRERVAAARAVQERRGAAGARTNAEIPDAVLDAVVRATPEARQLLGRPVERCGLSARAARRVLKVARTIADLAGEERTGPRAVAEALSYRGDIDPRA